MHLVKPSVCKRDILRNSDIYIAIPLFRTHGLMDTLYYSAIAMVVVHSMCTLNVAFYYNDSYLGITSLSIEIFSNQNINCFVYTCILWVHFLFIEVYYLSVLHG